MNTVVSGLYLKFYKNGCLQLTNSTVAGLSDGTPAFGKFMDSVSVFQISYNSSTIESFALTWTRDVCKGSIEWFYSLYF